MILQLRTLCDYKIKYLLAPILIDPRSTLMFELRQFSIKSQRKFIKYRDLRSDSIAGLQLFQNWNHFNIDSSTTFIALLSFIKTNSAMKIIELSKLKFPRLKVF